MADESQPADPPPPAASASAGDGKYPPAAVPTGEIDPLPGDRERTQLPERVVTYWQVQSALFYGPLTLIGAVIAFAVPGIGVLGQIALVGGPLLLGLLDAFVIEPKRRKLWWYSVGEHQIDLQHGWLWHTRTVVPMTRVQHIAMKRGPLADRFSLAELEIHTAAGSVKIPALDREQAIEFRQRVADLAQLSDDL